MMRLGYVIEWRYAGGPRCLGRGRTVNIEAYSGFFVGVMGWVNAAEAADPDPVFGYDDRLLDSVAFSTLDCAEVYDSQEAAETFMSADVEGHFLGSGVVRQVQLDQNGVAVRLA